MKLSGDVAILRLNNGKANSIDTAFLDQLERFVRDAPDIGARAMVITGYDNFFSAGLSLPGLFGLDRDAMKAFITRFGAVMLSLYASPLPVVAAVNGHAIAGGCVLALMADLRIMSDAGKIGLNEVKLGMGLPSSVLEPLRATVPSSSLRTIALEGHVLSAEDALALGLVDELCPRAEIDTLALERANELVKIAASGGGFAQVKTALRRPVLEAAARTAEEETERWLDSWFSEGARRRIAELVGKLTRK